MRREACPNAKVRWAPANPAKVARMRHRKARPSTANRWLVRSNTSIHEKRSITRGGTRERRTLLLETAETIIQ
jgi:hypothetical protein